ncbi:MAG: class I SAM-dependent rRNA methyltransferase [Lachnospiraceae bacterium]|nr:class I SAM-dependent rRNA methyltransferase [Lachnospiraceae bacterium]
MKVSAVITLKKGEGRLLKSGGAWIFDNEIADIEGSFLNGDVVSVRDFDGYPMGKGVINMNSKIRVRMLTRDKDTEIDREFFTKRLRAAWDYRRKTVDTGSCRIVFGDADFLPGITIDKYEDILVIESLSLGMDRMKELILEILTGILAEDGIKIRGIYERSDAKERLKEGMERKKGFIGQPFDTQVPITENGVHYLVDVAEGQKTGFFLDQKYNRAAIRPMCRGARVLDCFTHTGSFALNAALAGAESVLAVDASETALRQAIRNAELNGFAYEAGTTVKETQAGHGDADVMATEDERAGHTDAEREIPEDALTGRFMTNETGTKLGFMTADLVELLPQMERDGMQYDVVILDPPAFAKSRQNVKNAEKGYRKINRAGMRLVKDGGFLATCTCSHFMTRELFEKMVHEAAREAHVRLRQVEARTQAPDHPILWSAAESSCLKFYIFQVVKEQ